MKTMDQEVAQHRTQATIKRAILKEDGVLDLLQKLSDGYAPTELRGRRMPCQTPGCTARTNKNRERCIECRVKRSCTTPGCDGKVMADAVVVLCAACRSDLKCGNL